MTIYFFDTSALVKHYRPETGSPRVDAILGESDSTSLVSELALVEFASTFQRLKNSGEIDDPVMKHALARFTADTTGHLLVVGFRSDSIKKARELVLSHGIRTLDALQLASALAYAPLKPTFVCADSSLIKAAQANGLAILNPLASA